MSPHLMVNYHSNPSDCQSIIFTITIINNIITIIYQLAT